VDSVEAETGIEEIFNKYCDDLHLIEVNINFVKMLLKIKMYLGKI
jgi:hypothetical protein